MANENDDYEYSNNDEDILMEESIVWAYRPGRVLVPRLYLDMDDVLIEQLRVFCNKNIGITWKDYTSS